MYHPISSEATAQIIHPSYQISPINHQQVKGMHFIKYFIIMKVMVFFERFLLFIKILFLLALE